MAIKPNYFLLRFRYRITAKIRNTAASTLTTRSKRLLSGTGLAEVEIEDSAVLVSVLVEV